MKKLFNVNKIPENLTFLAVMSLKSWNASARVIVYIIYTRPTVQTGVINTIVNVCQKHRSIIYNVSGLLEVQVKLCQVFFWLNWYSMRKPNFFFKAAYLSGNDSQYAL